MRTVIPLTPHILGQILRAMETKLGAIMILGGIIVLTAIGHATDNLPTWLALIIGAAAVIRALVLYNEITSQKAAADKEEAAREKRNTRRRELAAEKKNRSEPGP